MAPAVGSPPTWRLIMRSISDCATTKSAAFPSPNKRARARYQPGDLTWIANDVPAADRAHRRTRRHGADDGRHPHPAAPLRIARGRARLRTVDTTAVARSARRGPHLPARK